MEHVKELHQALINTETYVAIYAVIPKNADCDEKYYSNDFSIAWILPNPLSDLEVRYKKHKHVDLMYSSDSIVIKGVAHPKHNLHITIKQAIKNKPNYVIKFHVDKELPFENYLYLLNQCKKANDQIRNEYSLKKYAISLENLDEDEHYEVRKIFPLNIWEETNW